MRSETLKKWNLGAVGIKSFYSNFFTKLKGYKYVWIKAVCTWYRQYRVSKSIAFLRTRYIEERLKVEKCKNIFFFGYEHLLKCKKKNPNFCDFFSFFLFSHCEQIFRIVRPDHDFMDTLYRNNAFYEVGGRI